MFKRHNKTSVLDGWRAFAMLCVFLFHLFFTLREVVPFDVFQEFYQATPWIFYWLWSGDRGVDIFFVLSGFLVGLSLLEELKSTGGINISRFWSRRFLRLVPVYYILLAIYWLSGAPNSASILSNIAFVNNYIPYQRSAMVWSWSLAVEVQFYIFLPLFLLYIFNRCAVVLRSQLLIFTLLMMVLVRGIVLLHDHQLHAAEAWRFFLDRDFFKYFFTEFYDNFELRVGSLWLGFMGAYLYLNYPKQVSLFFSQYFGRCLIVLGLLIITGLMLLPGFIYRIEFSEYRIWQEIYLFLHRYVFSAAITLILLFSLLGRGYLFSFIKGVLGSRIWTPIARLSYTMYLIHIVVIYGVYKVWLDPTNASAVGNADYAGFGFFQIAIVSLTISLVLSTFMYLFVERPFMLMRK